MKKIVYIINDRIVYFFFIFFGYYDRIVLFAVFNIIAKIFN